VQYCTMCTYIIFFPFTFFVDNGDLRTARLELPENGMDYGWKHRGR
jgi:hypothetical protein